MSTLECYFEGLAMERLETEWKKYPVLKISLANNKFTSLNALQVALCQILERFESRYGISNRRGAEWGPRLADILLAAYETTGMRPVVLVDEYDAPLLDSMDDPELQKILKEEMRKLFSPLKDLGGTLRFVFITGISKFSQLSIFSELNNLKVITMSDEYATICGITKDEVFTQLKPNIQRLADKHGLTYENACKALKQKYDGYHFSKNSPDIFNPFSLINSLSDCELSNYWFATGTPTILTKLIKKFDMAPEVLNTGFEATREMFDAPTETASNPIPMLYQSGYLTIKGTKSGGRYILKFPNDEVRFGFLKALMPYYCTKDVAQNDTFLMKLADTFESGDINEALRQIRAFIGSVPYNATKQNENYYRTLFFLIFKLCTPFVARAEECSAAGRADAVIETGNAVYVFEFKLEGNGSAEDALAQIDSKGYLIPYSATVSADGSPKKLYKIGASFDGEKRTIGEWIVRER